MNPEEHKPKVLLLDDEKFLLEMYKISFEKSGRFIVTAFSDAETALDALRTGYHPNLILFDIAMPNGLSGFEFIETLHNENLAKNALKVALTNEAHDAAKVRMGELGTDAHMQKAKYTPSEVVATVTEMLKVKNS